MISFAMFSRINGGIAEQNGYALPVVKQSTGVERSAFECILDEKSYVISQDGKHHQAVKRHLGELGSSLDEVSAIAERHGNQELKRNAAAVRSLATDYGRLYEAGVDPE